MALHRLLANMGGRRKLGDLALDALLFASMLSAGLYMARKVLRPVFSSISDFDLERRQINRRKAKAHLKRLNRPQVTENMEGNKTYRTLSVDDFDLNEYESLVALEMVSCEDIPVQFDGMCDGITIPVIPELQDKLRSGERAHLTMPDIGGLESIIEDLKESVLYPLTMPGLYSAASSLFCSPPGVLLYGPPGCGKTMLAKAIAREGGASFINLHISTMTEKWYGDSNKIIRAVFTLARKMQPAIIFIDEIDAVLGTRRAGEHEASAMIKAEFMTLWDGLASTNASDLANRIVVMGATNRITDIDDAILRRMPKKFLIPLPGQAQRREILHLLLKDSKIDPELLDLDYVSTAMTGFSGSDMKEACREAAMAPIREYWKAHRQPQSKSSLVQLDFAQLRDLTIDDLVKETKSRVYS